MLDHVNTFLKVSW